MAERRATEDIVTQSGSRSTVPVILAVTRNGQISDSVIKYTVGVADRLGFNILVAYVNTLPHLWDGGRHSQQLKVRAKENFTRYCQLASDSGVRITAVNEYGKIGRVIHRLCHIVRKIDFVIVEKGVNVAEAAYWSPVPVFDIRTGQKPSLRKAAEHSPRRFRKNLSYNTSPLQRHGLQCFIMATVVFVLYYQVFHNVDTVMEYWTKGGVYALLPVLTACAFFFAQSFLLQTCISLFRKEKCRQDVMTKGVSSSLGKEMRKKNENKG